MLNIKIINIIGVVATVVGMGANLLTNWVDDEKMKDEVKRQFEALSNMKES